MASADGEEIQIFIYQYEYVHQHKFDQLGHVVMPGDGAQIRTSLSSVSTN